ncbi:hypothetical protein KIN20_020123 [Parelaphostrongylus tenuis]|uniref:Uncharacterized protein n=1 Tax=Parelaphostrongylus tenuis TaxID=148309 RepID=A0AAD5N2X4_PARTN|nr:hypothetical protein KIN20_020123 [Parelaphostrongylus tenuis]
MLRSNHAAHVNRTAHSLQNTSTSIDTYIPHPDVGHVSPPTDSCMSKQVEMRRKKRGEHNKERGNDSQATTNPTSSPTTSAPTTLSKLMLRLAHSPYSILAPACLKDIAINTPEILCRFPQRHGIDLSSSSEML